MMQTDANTILCMTREEYDGVIKETKENLCFETAVTDKNIIREVLNNMPVWESIWIIPDEIYGVVFVG